MSINAAREAVHLQTYTKSKRAKPGLEFAKTAFEKQNVFRTYHATQNPNGGYILSKFYSPQIGMDFIASVCVLRLPPQNFVFESVANAEHVDDPPEIWI